MADYREYRGHKTDGDRLLRFMLEALRRKGCRMLHAPPPDVAPFRITFETPVGERLGIIAYASAVTARTPQDHRDDEFEFQINYGLDLDNRGGLHELWQDPYGIYTTLLLGIDVERGFFVGADPVLHNPTKMPVSLTFSHLDMRTIRANGWHTWEWEREPEDDDPDGIEIEWVKTLVGGTQEALLRYIRFEREAYGEDQGHRHLLAERAGSEMSARHRVQEITARPKGRPRSSR